MALGTRQPDPPDQPDQPEQSEQPEQTALPAPSVQAGPRNALEFRTDEWRYGEMCAPEHAPARLNILSGVRLLLDAIKSGTLNAPS